MPPNPLHARRALSAFQPTARVGAPFVITQKETESKLDQTDSAWRAFDSDLKDRLSFIDPNDPTGSVVAAIAATDANTDERSNLLAGYATDTGTKVAQSRANEAGKGADQVQTERAFYASWLKAYVRWRLFYLRNRSLTFTLYYADIWDSCDRFNSELGDWKDKAASEFNVKPSGTQPKKDPGKSLADVIPWGTIIAAVAGIALVTQLPAMLTKR